MQAMFEWIQFIGWWNLGKVKDLIAIILLEAVMTFFVTVVVAYIIREYEEIRMRQFAVLVLALTMMAGMLDSVAYFVSTPYTFFNTVFSFSISMITMAVAISALLWIATSHNEMVMRRSSLYSLVFLIAWNEVSMGILSYSLAFGPESFYVHGNLLLTLVNLFSLGTDSLFFAIPMAFEMVFTIFYKKQKGLRRIVLASILATSFFSPVILWKYFVLEYFLIADALVMVVIMVILFEEISLKKLSLKAGEMKSLYLVFLLFMLMMMSTFVGTVYYLPIPVAWLGVSLTMVIGMAFYFYLVLPPISSEEERRVGWLKHPGFMTFVLGTSFIAEWFISAAILFISQPIGNNSYGAGNFMAFSNALGGVSHLSAFSVPVDILYLIGTVTASFWFLAIMGLEMGSLVVFRMRQVHERGKRINLAFAMAAFALYTTYIPTVAPDSISQSFPDWANVGSLGPFLPSLTIAIVGSYVIYAILAILFGRRSYCGTLCPSAVMYGGTLGHEMISYNYGSKLSRSNIGSRFPKKIYPYIYASWIALFAVSAISYVSNSSVSLSLFGIDVSVFFSLIVWNFLWYMFFISIPFVGMSPCRRYGWCTTGTFVGFFSRLGMFKLKVRDSQQCVTCPTKDCVTACEVGLGDLPAQFIKNGFFKSSKCVGSGSCLEACPYDNIFFYDVRDYFRNRKEKKGIRKP